MFNMLWKRSMGSDTPISSPKSKININKFKSSLTSCYIMAGSVRISPGYEIDETYEIEFRDHTVDHLILEYDQDKGCIFVKLIIKSPYDSILKKVVKVGDVLLAVNSHVILDEDINDIAAYFDMLKRSLIPRRLTLLNVSRCSFSSYMEKVMPSRKVKKDMFGFSRTLDYLVEEKFQQSQLGTLMSQRDIEWVEYLKAIGGPDNLKPAGVFKPSKELKNLVRRGIPVAYRSLVWQKISLSSLHRREFGANYYSSLLIQADLKLDARVRDDIEKDIDRTFPEHDYFGVKGPGEDSLRRILVAYAIHNPEIGYCQSLNFVGGLMLLFMEEEDAFWLLLTVIETLLPKDYYTRNMIGTYTDQYVLGKLIQERLPHMYNALEVANLELPLVTVQWFMCLYVNTLRPEVALRVWDMFLNEGSKVLFRIAMALFKLNEKVLMEATDSGNLFLRLRDIGKDITDPEILISTAYKAYKPALSSNSIIPPKTSFIRKRNESSLSGSLHNNLQPPKDLTGLGLAHLGPVTQNFTSSSDTSTIGEFNDSDCTSEETPDEYSSSFDGSESVLIACETGLATLKSRSTSFVRLDDGRLSEMLIADMSSLSKQAALGNVSNLTNSGKLITSTSLSKYKGGLTVAITDDDYRNFKRHDIEILRTKYRVEVMQQFEDMDFARRKWKEDQILKASPREAENTLEFLPAPEDINTDHPQTISPDNAKSIVEET